MRKHVFKENDAFSMFDVVYKVCGPLHCSIIDIMMGVRALDGYKCHNCNNVTRLVVLPYSNKDHDKPFRVRDKRMNTHLVICDGRLNNKCKPPDVEDHSDVQSKGGFAFNSECQLLAVLLNRGIDFRCQDQLAKNVSCTACMWILSNHILEKQIGKNL